MPRIWTCPPGSKRVKNSRIDRCSVLVDFRSPDKPVLYKPTVGGVFVNNYYYPALGRFIRQIFVYG